MVILDRHELFIYINTLATLAPTMIWTSYNIWISIEIKTNISLVKKSTFNSFLEFHNIWVNKCLLCIGRWKLVPNENYYAIQTYNKMHSKCKVQVEWRTVGLKIKKHIMERFNSIKIDYAHMLCSLKSYSLSLCTWNVWTSHARSLEIKSRLNYKWLVWRMCCHSEHHGCFQILNFFIIPTFIVDVDLIG
jgi:hypothetical protein